MIREADWGGPVVLVVAPTGAEVTREDNPAVPYTPGEIASSVIEAHAASAAVAHLHVREADGAPSARPELFRAAVDGIRAGCDASTMVSTGGAMGMSLAERTAGLEARPDMSGLETGSLNFGPDLFPTLPHESEEIAGRAAAAGIGLEVEAFEVGHVDAAVAMRRAGTLPEPLRINLVVGVPGAMAATARNLLALIAAVPDGVPWGVTAIGRHQTRMLALGLALGATCIRVGFEDNVYLRKGVLAASNAELVAHARALTERMGRRVAGPEEARGLLGL